MKIQEDNFNLDSFLNNAEVIFVTDAKSFDINEWEDNNINEIEEELGIND